MFDLIFPKHWSTLKKLIWLMAAALSSAVVKTVTAAIVHIRDALAGPAQNVTIAIEPVQAGTGDPSPDNVRPISGWTGANVTRTGKNLFDISAPDNANDYYYDDSGVKTYDGISLASGLIPCKPNTAYTVQNIPYWGSSSNTRLLAYDKNQNFIGLLAKKQAQQYQLTAVSATTPANAAFLRISGYLGPVNGRNTMLSEAEESSAYEAYTGTTIPITFPDAAGTVYGGTLDVTNGVLTVTHVCETFTGANIYSADSDFSSARKYAAVRRTYASKTAGYRVSNSYKALLSTDTDTTGFLFVSNTNLRVRIFDPRFTDLATAQTLLNATPFQLVYALATPQTYQLTPQEIQLLAGENNLWADTGNTTLTYLADGRASDTEALGILLAGRYVNHGAADEATDAEALNILLGR